MKMIDKLSGNDGPDGGSTAKTNTLRSIEASINNTSIEIFRLYRHKLMQAPVTFIIPVVWGVDQSGVSDPERQAIFDLVVLLMEDIYKALHLSDQDRTYRYAFEYMVRGMVVMKIAYMIQLCINMKKPKSFTDGLLKDHDWHNLKDIEPAGRA